MLKNSAAEDMFRSRQLIIQDFRRRYYYKVRVINKMLETRRHQEGEFDFELQYDNYKQGTKVYHPIPNLILFRFPLSLFVLLSFNIYPVLISALPPHSRMLRS
jgi:hypothetical protein